MSQLFDLLIGPVVSEKATSLMQEGQYVFYVRPEADKITLTRAFEQAFEGRKIKSIKTVRESSRTITRGRRKGQQPARKKAIIRIEGEPLDLFGQGAV